MRDESTGVCSECGSPPEAYHGRRCSLFKGYHCWNCAGTYYGECCLTCPPPFWVEELSSDNAGVRGLTQP